MGVITHPLMPAVRCKSVQLGWMGVRSWLGRMRRWYRRARCAGRSGGHYRRVSFVWIRVSADLVLSIRGARSSLQLTSVAA